MNIGILGTNFGAFHASIYKRQQRVGAVRMWGRNQARLDGLRKEMNIETVSDIDEILNDPSIDLVDICLPTPMHHEYAIRALNSGKNVFCETPLCTELEGNDKILEAARKSGKRLFVDQFIKFIQEYRLVKETADDGRYGKLISLNAWRNTAPVWGKLGNDIIASSLMIHELDFVTWLLGTPVGIEAKAHAKNEGETNVVAILSYPDVLVSILASSSMPIGYPFTTGFMAAFENGTLQAACSFIDDVPQKTILEYANGVVRPVDMSLLDPYELAIAHVLDCCQTGKDSCISGEYAAMAAKTAIEITKLIN